MLFEEFTQGSLMPKINFLRQKNVTCRVDTDRQTDRHTHTQTHTDKDKDTDKDTDTYTDTDTNKDTDKDKDTDKVAKKSNICFIFEILMTYSFQI